MRVCLAFWWVVDGGRELTRVHLATHLSSATHFTIPKPELHHRGRHQHHDNDDEQRRPPIGADELAWLDKLAAVGTGWVDLAAWQAIPNDVNRTNVVSRSGCCPLAYDMDVNTGNLRLFRFGFGAARFPCCVGDLEWYWSEGEWRTRPRSPPASLLRDEDHDEEPDLAKIFKGRTVVVAGDSVARQVLLAMICAIDERPLRISRPSSGWARGSDLLATYRRFSIVRAGDRGRNALTETARIAEAAPRPVELVLVGGGSAGLGHRWLAGKCANHSLADDLDRSSDRNCEDEYRRAANASLARAVRAVGGNPDAVHLVSTTPQHNPTRTGEWYASRVKEDKATVEMALLELRLVTSAPSFANDVTESTNERPPATTPGTDKCVPLSFPASRTDHWRNDALREAAAYWRVNFYDAFDMFKGYWDAHVEHVVKFSNSRGAAGHRTEDFPNNPSSSRDCAHYCQHRTVWRRLLVHIAQRVVLNRAIENQTSTLTFDAIAARVANATAMRRFPS